MTSTFTLDLAARITRDSACIIAEPVIDRCRFPDRQFTPAPPERILQVLAQLLAQAPAIESAAGSFADTESVSLLAGLLTYRALGPCRYALPLSNKAYLAPYEEESRFRVTRTAARLHWPQSLFRLEFLEPELELDVWDGNIAATFLRKQCFFSRGGILIAPSPGDVAIDCGGCLGRTALAFAAAVGKSGHVYTLEPIARCAGRLQENLARNPAVANRVTVLRNAVTDRSGDTLRMVECDAGSYIDATGSDACETLSIDDPCRATHWRALISSRWT